MEAVIAEGRVTEDLAASNPEAQAVGCRAFAELVCEQLENLDGRY